jgi:hypothetical protein
MPTVVTPQPDRGLLLHPAFDLQAGVVSFGFRDDTFRDGKPRTEVVHVVNVRGHLAMIGASGTVGGSMIRYRDPLGLAGLEAQWGQQNLAEFREDYSAPHGVELYKALVATWERHVHLEQRGQYVILTCWGVMTYVYYAFPSVPFLHLLGDKSTGKSQALDLLEQLSRDGQKVRPTAPAVGDITHARRPTLLIDQADNLNPDLVDLLADSYRRGTRRIIVNMDRRGQVQEFETFGPKALAGTQPLTDDLRDRAIVIEMRPAPRRLPPVHADDPALRRLRADCYAWALRNGCMMPDLGETLLSAERHPLLAAEWRELVGYYGRQHDLWLPIECIMEALRVPPDDREAARNYYRQSQTVTTAEPPQERFDLVRVLWELGTEPQRSEGPTFSVTASEIEARLPVVPSADGLASAWDRRKIGKQMTALVGVLRRKERTSDRADVRYEIDREALRRRAREYGLTE